MISLDLYGEPVAKVRARTVRRHKFVNTYDPQQKIKEGYKWQLKGIYREQPLNGPLAMDITFFMPIPKSTSKVKRRAMANGSIYHISRPDLDNLEKFILDTMNEIIFVDDSQIVSLTARKVYSENPGTNIRIRCLNQQSEENQNENSQRNL